MRKPYKKLTYADRQMIERMVGLNKDVKEIAKATGVHVATIYKELQRGTNEEGDYKAEKAQKSLFCINNI